VRQALWRRSDTFALVLLTVLAGGVRLAGLGIPAELVFDESYYAQDACWYVYHSATPCQHSSELTRFHPPLGKWLIAAGIALFGYTPLGWRSAGWLVGTLTVPLLYLMARRLLGSAGGAALAAGLLAVDFLHFVHSRVAMLDIFVMAFALAAFTGAVYDRDDPVPRGWWRPWRVAAGVAAGAAAAAKWSGIPVLGGVILLTAWWDLRRGRGLGSIVLPLVLLPAAVYAAAHIGVIEGTLFAPPWERGSWGFEFLRRQWQAVKFHTRPFPLHPYQSPAWSWLLLRRPVIYFWDEPGGAIREILATGNPLVWWPAAAALVVAAVRAIRRRTDPDVVVLVGFAVTYLPWLGLTPARSFVFIFYLLPAIPFLCLALARAALPGAGRVWRTAAMAGYAAVVMAATAFYYPVLTARPMAYEAWRARLGPFRECGPVGTPGGGRLDGTRHLPARIPGAPPPGWCWL
jgi:dolichyl-phosphate-mannose--protein O-mannosyl transferase